ncbi:uncharacterized protein I206_101846 [Kwoniella pini CBS 10737]|uniref:F-box domain-containing protein n=1 Tax=Kwoniella pini CBS 10737 TaxID=1296096 RepID=A0A1B9HVI5_9TREE|nr:uncharacterized protein I206_07063 [Kwoniella pini CBS 10737]OCF47285.1 hypothetical protein I206_07063 [Kwoniella pini CBS 10737]
MSILPHELLTYIFDYLEFTDRKALTKCLRVSKLFYNLSAPVLYKDINLTPSGRFDVAAYFSPNALTILERKDPRTRKRKLMSHSAVVRVDAHDSRQCKGKEWRYPRATILHVTAFPNLRSLHHDTVLYGVAPRLCPIIKELKP